jgi:hypothetical protein
MIFVPNLVRSAGRASTLGPAACFAIYALATTWTQVNADPPGGPPVTRGQVGAPASVAAMTALDEPLRLIASARQSYQGMHDYQCLFVKRERLRGQLQPDNLIEMKVLTQPFSVYLRWMAPQSSAGQQACYVAGRNNGMMRVHSTGLAGVVGFISIDPRDPRATETSRHAITEAGIGNLIERFGQRWEVERQLNRTQVRVAEYMYNQKRCTRVEVAHPDRGNGQYSFYRSVVYFDQEKHLPIRVENYDWPRAGGPADGDLLESYSYVDLRVNTGLGPAAFNY